MSQRKIETLHKRITLKKAVTRENHICEICQATKLKQYINRELAEYKKNLLNLVSIDIGGLFSESTDGNRYFLEIKDNYSRYEWIKSCKNRIDIIR